MRICFLASANSIHSYRWVRYFAEKGHEVHWISQTPFTEGDVENVKLYLVRGLPLGRPPPLNLLLNVIRVKGLIKKINPDILHAHYAGVNGVVGALSGFHPFVLTAWGSDVLFAAESRIKGPLVKFALNKADLITCDADHMMGAMTRLGVNNKKIELIYFGVDTRKFKPEEKDKKLRNVLKIFDSPTIISLRNLEPIYDVESLISSIPRVLKEIPEAKFVIAGEGSQEEGLIRFAKSLRVSDSIRFVGWISNDEIPRYLTSVDIYVSTSLSDAGLASSTAEAMACGLPVVITDSGENRKWVEDGENGFVIPPKDAETLAEKIVYLLRNDGIRARFGESSRKIIEERNNYYKEMAKMEESYRKLIEVQ